MTDDPWDQRRLALDEDDPWGNGPVDLGEETPSTVDVAEFDDQSWRDAAPLAAADPVDPRDTDAHLLLEAEPAAAPTVPAPPPAAPADPSVGRAHPAPTPSPAPSPAPVRPKKTGGASEPKAEPAGGFMAKLTGMFSRSSEPKASSNDELIGKVRTPLRKAVNIVLVNEDGGTGKTTTAVLLGMLLASLREDRVIAVDASPGCGELAHRAPQEKVGRGSVRSVHEQINFISRHSHVREHTSQSPSGLEVLGSDPAVVPEARFTGEAYTQIVEKLREFYGIIITDCAAGMLSDVVDAALDDADVLVIVSEGGDGVRAGTWTANYLAERGKAKPRYRKLLNDAVVVTNTRTEKTNVNIDTVTKYYEAIVRSVVRLPFDRHLEGGNSVSLDALSAKTYRQVLAIAEAVVGSEGFARAAAGR